MENRNIITIVNALTGETITRELTPEEISELQTVKATDETPTAD